MQQFLLRLLMQLLFKAAWKGGAALGTGIAIASHKVSNKVAERKKQKHLLSATQTTNSGSAPKLSEPKFIEPDFEATVSSYSGVRSRYIL